MEEDKTYNAEERRLMIRERQAKVMRINAEIAQHETKLAELNRVKQRLKSEMYNLATLTPNDKEVVKV
jgi:hypothetical protein